MNIALIVTAAPHQENAWQALHFARAALAAGHHVPRVFFYGDGALHGNVLLLPPQDEAHVSRDWATLAGTHDIELVICIAAALKRGVMDHDTAAREDRNVSNLAKGYTISGLGQLAEAMIEADRLVSFPA
ncbi:MAG TPA: sulfurtransferase complex subunit TusD [Moraxellaceae bacterium]|nr:sulfurtransferase complex subunit TusD [Moraxellaceae bacterium]